MKYYDLYIAALALLPLLTAGCQQEDGLPPHTGYSDEVITFNTPYWARSVLRDGDFEEGDKVGVIGYCKRGENPSNPDADMGPYPWEAKRVFAQPDMFYNKELTYAGNGTFTYEGYYDEDHQEVYTGICPWYNDRSYYYSFFAYYPYAELTNGNTGTIRDAGGNAMGTITLSGENAEGNPVITYTMPRTGSESTAQISKLDNVPDFMLAYVTNHRQQNGAVPLEFRHLFAALQFEVNNYTPNDATIEYIKLEGSRFYKSITVTGEQSGYDVGSDRYSGVFDVLDGQGSLLCPAGTIEATGGDGSTSGEITPKTTTITDRNGEPVTLMFITDDDDNSDNKGAIVDGSGFCRISVKVTGRIEAPLEITENKTFNAGTRNIFSINLVGNNLILQLRATDRWEDDGDSEIVFE